jgi:hypothetical protein
MTKSQQMPLQCVSEPSEMWTLALNLPKFFVVKVQQELFQINATTN